MTTSDRWAREVALALLYIIVWRLALSFGASWWQGWGFGWAVTQPVNIIAYTIDRNA